MVVIWPYAVALTAAATFWSLSFESLVYFMVKHVTTSPTESAAAALFAVVVALSSSGYNFDNFLLSYSSQEAASGKEGASGEKESDSASASATSLIEQMKWTSGTVVDKLNILAQYYSSENFNQQYADSVQYLKDVAEYLQGKEVTPSQLQIPYLTAPAQEEGKPLHGNDTTTTKSTREEEVGTFKGGVVEELEELSTEEEKESGWVRHRFLYEAFTKCCSTFSGGLLPDRAFIADLFRLENKNREEGLLEVSGEKESGGQDWKEILRKETESMQYTAWSMPLRKGLKVYRTKTIFRNATAADFIGFMTDDSFRREWDLNSTVWDTDANVRKGMKCGGGAGKKSANLSNIYCRMKIPPPFASRQYFLKRSVWQNERGDGEIICSIDDTANANGQQQRATGNNVTIQDYLSLCSARTLLESSSVEVTFMYFEDTRLPSTLVNQIVKCRMENTLVKTEQALRMHMSLKLDKDKEEEEKKKKKKKKKTPSITEAGKEEDGDEAPVAAVVIGNNSCRSSSSSKGKSGDGPLSREANRRKGLFGRMASVVTAACLLNRGRLVIPFILSELTRAQQQSRM